MNNLAQFSATATVEAVLKKLNKAQIAAYKLKKQGSEVHFCVEEEYTQKVFAIFSHPCYNICIRRKSAKTRFLNFAKRRFGLFVGAAAFVALCSLADSMVFKIKVVGSGNYLAPQILAAANECGAREYSFCTALDKPALTSRVLALPSVTFCSVQREGSILVIEVQTAEEHSAETNYSPLKSPCEGEIYRLVAVCGTAEKSEGDKIAAGETLIAAYSLNEQGEKRPCLAVGFAEIKRQGKLTAFFTEESEANLNSAYSATALYSDKVLEKSYRVSPCEGGVTYEISFTYLITVTVNMQ